MAQTAPNTVVLAVDEASLYLQATTMAVWAPRGRPLMVRCDPGRAKTSFYGALNLHTGQETVMDATTLNAVTTVQYLQQVLTTYPDQPLLLLWDRAPWHRGAAIRELLAAHPRLEVVEFPTAAPDLNPQEHVWKAARRAVSHNHTDPTLTTLAARFRMHLTTTQFPSSFPDQYGWNVVVRPRFN